MLFSESFTILLRYDGTVKFMVSVEFDGFDMPMLVPIVAFGTLVKYNGTVVRFALGIFGIGVGGTVIGWGAEWLGKFTVYVKFNTLLLV
jgi:hypothetical protein